MPEEFANASFAPPLVNLSSRIPWNSLDNRLASCSYWAEDGERVGCGEEGWIYDRYRGCLEDGIFFEPSKSVTFSGAFSAAAP